MNLLTCNLKRVNENYIKRGVVNHSTYIVLKYTELLEKEMDQSIKLNLIIRLFCIPVDFEYSDGELKKELSSVIKKFGYESLLKAIEDFVSRSDLKDEKPNKKSKNKKVIDFNQDADLIYSAFMQQYGIDLTENDLHWYKFISLLQGLTDETNLGSIIGIRSMPMPSTKNREEYERIKKLKSQFKLINKNEKIESPFAALKKAAMSQQN